MVPQSRRTAVRYHPPMTEQLKPDPIALLAATPALFRTLFDAIPTPLLEATGAPDWGPKECLAHLLDTGDIAFATRIRRIVEEARPYIRSIDPPARLAASGYLDRTAADLLAEFEGQRTEHLAWLRTIPEAAFDRAGEHDEAGEITARNILYYWPRHDLAHLRQALTAAEVPLHAYVGNTKRFFENV